MKPQLLVDLFCGAGGTSTGMLQAARRLRRCVKLTAVNHWDTAINSHSLNHPSVTHLCQTVESIWPRNVIPGRYLRLLAASCECTFHSNARGGGPCNEQSRSQPHQILRWLTDLIVDDLLMENVPEFVNWGPLLIKGIRFQGRYYKKDCPDPRYKGVYFQAFIKSIKDLGYSVEWKIQTAADFGDPTSRRRFILMARRNGKAIVWPEPTHGPGRRHPHQAARGCIDFSLVSKTIFTGNQAKPFRHCPNTIRRIAGGLKKFGGAHAEPFLMVLRGTAERQLDNSQSLNEPLPTITGSGAHLCLVEPFLVQTDQQGSNGDCASSLDDPLKTIVTKQNMLLVQMLMKYYATGICQSLDAPLDTVTTKDRFLLVEADQIPGYRPDVRTRLLQPHELAAAHSFPRHYIFTGSKEDQTMQIGNSVPVKLAEAHAFALLRN